MILEIVAALVVGGFALALVIEPLLRNIRRPPASLELPDLEETPRGIAVAALREIEFDRETGKLSDADYAELKQRYTEDAVRAMRAEERESDAAAPDAALEEPDAVEAIISAKVRALRAQKPGGAAEVACLTCGPRPEPDAIFCSTCGTRLPTGVSCVSCSAPLVPGSKYCEACGVQQAKTA